MQEAIDLANRHQVEDIVGSVDLQLKQSKLSVSFSTRG